MQAQRRSRVAPIIKRVAIAVAVKKGIDMFQEARRPKKPSLIGRLAKLGVWAAGGGGLFYAFVSGKLQPLVDKVMGASSSSDQSDRWTSPSTISTGSTQSSSSASSSSTPTDGNLSSSPSSSSV
jgi:hypothetical protein